MKSTKTILFVCLSIAPLHFAASQSMNPVVRKQVSVGPILQHADGGRTAFPPRSNTNASRGAALLAAQDAAVRGDTIVVGAGVYDIQSTLGKHLVDWYFYPGAVVTSSVVNIWGDGGEDLTYTVKGHGVFNHTGIATNNENLGRFTGASNICIEFHEGASHFGRAFTTFNSGLNLKLRWTGTVCTKDGGIDNVGGTITIHGHRLSSEGLTLESDGDLTIAYIDELVSLTTTPVELVFGEIRVFNATIRALHPGKAVAQNSSEGLPDGIFLHNCILDTNMEFPFFGTVHVSNVSRLDGLKTLGNDVVFLDINE
ncbi:MAG: hypothetical protein MI923_21510 [Phycisphaerales bacterium]|nr:hypothetical protein [Phycisphaerales bacterium]